MNRVVIYQVTKMLVLIVSRLSLAVFFCHSVISASVFVVQEDNPEKVTVADTVKWQPEVVYIAHPDMKFAFKLPLKKDQDDSGVANLFFQCRETGEIHLLDSFGLDNMRVYNSRISSGNHDAVLLYNNGKYIRYDSIVVKKDNLTEVDMMKLEIQPSNVESQRWLSLRSFNSPKFIHCPLGYYVDDYWHLSVNDTSKWHPEAFYIVYPDMKLTFKFPCEKDQSGFANLLFIDRETGAVHLLDTVKNNTRFSNRLSGKYDAILLYNNGKYIRYKDVAFEKNKNIEIDMGQNDVQPSDHESQYWLTLRAFGSVVGDRLVRKSYTDVSEKKIRGYVFDSIGGVLMISVIKGIGSDGILKGAAASSIDGYFEYDTFDANTTLEIFYLGFETQKIDIKANSGLFLRMKDAPRDNIIVTTGTVLTTPQ